MRAPPEAHRVTVWTLALTDTPDPPPPTLVTTLDAEERARAEQFRQAQDRVAYLWAHALVRGLLSTVYGQPAAAWRFCRPPGQRPEVVAPPPASRPRFSLTHTTGLVAVAVCEGAAVGIDAEWRLGPALEKDDLRAVVCTSAERRRLAQVAAAGGDWRQAFYDLWVRKEAVAKALGLGLSLPLDKLDVTTDEPHLLVPGPWDATPLQLWQPPCGRDHAVAVALPAADSRPRRHRAISADVLVATLTGDRPDTGRWP